MSDERRPIRRGRDGIRGAADDRARLPSILSGAFGSLFLGVFVCVLLVACGGGTDVPTDTASPSLGAAGPTASSGSAVATPFPSDPFASAPIPESPVAGVVEAVEGGASPVPSAGGSGSAKPAGSATARPGGSASAPADGSAPITGFTLRTTSGVELRFVIGQVDDLSDFPLSSLADHAASQVPVLVYFKVQGADLVVYHLEDAG